MVLSCTHRPVPCFSLQETGNKCRNPQSDIIQSVRDLGTLSLRYDVFIKFPPQSSGNNTMEQEAQRARGFGGHQESKAFYIDKGR